MTEENKGFNSFLNEVIDDGIDESLMKDDLLLEKVQKYKRRKSFRRFVQVAAVVIIVLGFTIYHAPLDDSKVIVNGDYVASEELQIIELTEELELYEAMFGNENQENSGNG